MCQLGAWISALLILKRQIGSFGVLPKDLSAARDTYLAFSISGFALAILLYLFFLLNIRSVKPFKQAKDIFLNLFVIIFLNFRMLFLEDIFLY